MLSVVMPTLNEEEYIERTLSSVRDQEMDVEIVIVDGESTDGTRAIAEEYADKLIVQDSNIPEARNVGAEEASGDIIFFLDSDIILSPGFLGKVSETLSADSVVGVVSGRDVPLEDGLRPRTLSSLLNGIAYFLSVTPFPGPVGSSGVAIGVERETFEEVGGFDEDLVGTEELDFARKVKRHGKIKCIRSVSNRTHLRRFEHNGYSRTSLEWFLKWLLYTTRLRESCEEYNIYR